MSRQYEDLLQSLGWLVDPAEHLGFRSEKLGGEKAQAQQHRLLYYANAFEEVHFHIPDWEYMGTSAKDWLAHGKLHAPPMVLVLWNACGQQQFSPRTKYFSWYRAPRAYYYIIIDPLPNGGLYRIRWVKYEGNTA